MEFIKMFIARKFRHVWELDLFWNDNYLEMEGDIMKLIAQLGCKILPNEHRDPFWRYTRYQVWATGEQMGKIWRRAGLWESELKEIGVL